MLYPNPSFCRSVNSRQRFKKARKSHHRGACRVKCFLHPETRSSRIATAPISLTRIYGSPCSPGVWLPRFLQDSVLVFSMTHATRPLMQWLLKLLMTLMFVNNCNAASLIRPPPLDELLPNPNLTNIASPISTETLAAGTQNINDILKEGYAGVRAQYPKAFLVGVRIKVSGLNKYQSVRMIFNNIARAQDKGIVLLLGPGGVWLQPRFVSRDYGVGNKYIFTISPALRDVDAILRTRYPRATYTEISLFYPKQNFGRAEQPYWIFTMVDSIFWDKYTWVGAIDHSVSESHEIPESIKSRQSSIS